MMLRNALVGGLICWGLIGGIGYGCASLTPGAAAKASQAITVAQNLLHELDGFYEKLVDMKAVNDKRIEATRALAIADAAAVSLRHIIAGGAVDDTSLNVVAGQVSGAKAIAEQAQ